MKRIYESALKAVSEVYGIPEILILTGKDESCVDARSVLIHVLGQRMTDREISDMTGIRKSSVNYIRNQFLYKISKYSISVRLHSVLGEMERCPAWNLVYSH